MGVFSRLSDIINSNINSMLDSAENPEKIARLIIQEMEDTLVEVRSSAARHIAEKKEIQRKLEEFTARADDWQNKAEFAITKGRDDLAKSALVARNKAHEMVEMLEKEIQIVDDSLIKAQTDLEQLQVKLKEAKARQRQLEIRRQSATDSIRVKKHLYDGRVDDAIARYESFERKVDELEAEAESMSLGQPKTLSEQFAELETADSLDLELAELKKKVSGEHSPENPA